jgi:hypothetical protein
LTTTPDKPAVPKQDANRQAMAQWANCKQRGNRKQSAEATEICAQLFDSSPAWASNGHSVFHGRHNCTTKRPRATERDERFINIDSSTWDSCVCTTLHCPRR